MDPVDLARTIDHTILNPAATNLDILRLVAECREHGLLCACVNPRWVSLAVCELQDSGVVVASVAGFPLGANDSAVKAVEADAAVTDGAAEIDMVLSVGDLVAGDLRRVEEDIRAVRDAVPGVILKVILECALLTHEQKVAGAKACVEAGADFVKTSTGFGPGGATEADVRLLRETVGPDVGVKAAGGIRTRDEALRMLAAGANRIGTSSGPAIVTGSSA